MNQFLTDRRKELAEIANKRGIDWSARLGTLPEDDVLQVAGLATLLHLDVRDVINPKKSLSQLTAQRDDAGPTGISYLEHLLLHGTTNR